MSDVRAMVPHALRCRKPRLFTLTLWLGRFVVAFAIGGAL